MSRKILLAVLVCGAVLLVGSTAQAVTSTFTIAETTTNLALGSDDQTAATTTSVANVSEVKASTTLTIVSLPASDTTITVGACVITASSTDSTNCTGGTARIATTTSQDGVIANARTAAQFATALQGLTYVKNPVASSSTNIIVSASSTSANLVGFSTAASSTETGGRILATTTSPSTVVSFAATSTFTGVAPVAMIETVTVGGSVEEDDVYTLKMGSVSAAYTVLSTDTTTSNVATGLNTAIQAATGYAGLTYSSTVSTNVISLTAETAGTSFDPATTTPANRAARKQVVTFTPANITVGETFRLIINGVIHSYLAVTGDTVATVVSGLANSAATDASADCVNTTNTKVTCTAKTAGTASTYQAAIIGASSADTSSGGTGGGGAPYVAPPAPPSIPPTVLAMLTKTLSDGKSNKEVKLLQEKLKLLGFMKASQRTTNYFGMATKKALIKFQMKNKLRPYNGVLNKKTRALLNSL